MLSDDTIEISNTRLLQMVCDQLAELADYLAEQVGK